MGVAAICHADDGDDELADYHAEGTPQEQGPTTDLLDGPEGDWGGADVDDCGDHGQQEGVLDRAQLLEEGGTKVEDEVDTGPPKKYRISTPVTLKIFRGGLTVASFAERYRGLCGGDCCWGGKCCRGSS